MGKANAIIYPTGINPFTLREAKRGLMILEIFTYEGIFLKIFEGEMFIRS